jgi:hypothetical protein
MVMHTEHKLPVLRTGCRIDPNAAITTVKADHGKISARRSRHTEADSE